MTLPYIKAIGFQDISKRFLCQGPCLCRQWETSQMLPDVFAECALLPFKQYILPSEPDHRCRFAFWSPEWKHELGRARPHRPLHSTHLLHAFGLIAAHPEGGSHAVALVGVRNFQRKIRRSMGCQSSISFVVTASVVVMLVP